MNDKIPVLTQSASKMTELIFKMLIICPQPNRTGRPYNVTGHPEV